MCWASTTTLSSAEYLVHTMQAVPINYLTHRFLQLRTGGAGPSNGLGGVAAVAGAAAADWLGLGFVSLLGGPAGVATGLGFVSLLGGLAGVATGLGFVSFWGGLAGVATGLDFVSLLAGVLPKAFVANELRPRG
jgi:hypothetical protein